MDIKRFKESWREAFSNRLNLNERKQTKKWKRYLLAEYNKGIESYLSTNSEREFSNLFKVRDIENLYIDLYEEVGVDFAKWYARSFDKFIEKNSGNESTWRTTFSRIGQTEAGDKIILVQGTALKELKRNIGNLFKDPEFQSLGRKQQGRILQSRYKVITEYQAQRIVRTEATSAANEGIMQSAQDIFPKSSLVKEWVSSQDGRTRAFNRGDKSDHLNMNGKVVGFNETFAVSELGRVVQMRKPADFKSGASAHNIVNCRCSMAVYPKEGAEVSEGVSLTGVGGGVSAITSQLIGDEIVTSRKPATDITSRERAQEFLNIDRLKESEVKDFIRNRFKENKIKIKSFTKGNQSVKSLKKRAKQLDKLLNEYDVSHPLNQIDEVTLEFTTKNRGRELGSVGRVVLDYSIRTGSKPEGYLKTINLGVKNSGTPRENYLFKDYNPKGYKFERWSSFVDKENQDIAVLTHEFAHIITNSRYGMHKKFWEEFSVIKDEYFERLNKYTYPKPTEIDLGDGRFAMTIFKNTQKYDEIALGKYAHTNDNEILAEAFREYKLSSKPREYAVKFGKLIDKYFKK